MTLFRIHVGPIAMEVALVRSFLRLLRFIADHQIWIEGSAADHHQFTASQDMYFDKSFSD
jgi:hypothetical protein